MNICRRRWCFTSWWVQSPLAANATANNLQQWPSLHTRPWLRSHFPWVAKDQKRQGYKSIILLPQNNSASAVCLPGPPVIRPSTCLFSFLPFPIRVPSPFVGFSCGEPKSRSQADSVFICWWSVSPSCRNEMSRVQELHLSCSLSYSYCLTAHSNYNYMGEIIKWWMNI